MEFYAVLIASTAVIAVLAVLLYLKTREVAYLVGIALEYYFSLLAPWSVIGQRMTGTATPQLHNLSQVLGSINLDASYLWTLNLYSLFIVATELGLLWFALPHAPPSRRAAVPVVVSGRMLAAVSALATAALIALVYDRAADFAQDKSLYVAHQDFDAITMNLYAVLLYLASATSALGTVLLFDGGQGRLITATGKRTFGLACVAVAVFLVGFRVAMGSKGVSLQTLLFAGLFYVANARRPRYLPFAAVGTACLLIMGIADASRGDTLPELFDRLSSPSWDMMVEGSHKVIASGEKLAAHMSLYAVLDRGVELTGGSSVVSLLASVVPQFLWPERPEPVYSYYRDVLGLPSNQGFTIHHAAGWYLNFGSWGVAAGGLAFGVVWSFLAAFPYRHGVRARATRLGRCLAAIAPFVFVSAVPSLMRNGMEGYKTLVMELACLAIVVRVAWVGGACRALSRSQAEAVARPSTGARCRPELSRRPMPATHPAHSPAPMGRYP